MTEKIFLSYVSEDRDKARRLVADLAKRDLDVRTDEEILRVGDNWELKLKEAIESAPAYIALVSSRWLSKPEGTYALPELGLALKRLERRPASRKYLFPVRLDEIEPQSLHPSINSFHYTDLFPSEDDWNAGVDELAHELHLTLAALEAVHDSTRRREDEPEVGAELPRRPRLAAPSRTQPPSAKVVTDPDHFRMRIKARAPWKSLDDIPEMKCHLVRKPKFILFERVGELILVIATTEKSKKIDRFALQKTTEKPVKAELADAATMADAGFPGSRVHPFFLDPARRIQRIFIDALLVTQAIWFPQSWIALPLYHSDGREETAVTSIRTFIEVLREVHSEEDRVIIANVSRSQWPDFIFEALLKDRPVSTRYAPTPSNTQHVGNARTALLTYMFHLQHLPDSRFHLRIDDTNKTHRSQAVVREIRDELRWLGLRWEDSFHQSGEDSFANYDKFTTILELAGLGERTDRGFRLRSLPEEGYYNLWVDLRNGPQVAHAPPSDKEGKSKPIFLVRHPDEDPDEGPFYRYAGLVDDLLRSTHIFRDRGQVFLTEVQGHIRRAFESARVHHRNSIAELLLSQDLDPDSVLPLPIYGHVPWVRRFDQGRKLSKRAEDDEYRLRHLRLTEGILPETVVAWLIATIFKPQSIRGRRLDWHQHLWEIGRTVARHNSLEITLHFFARSLDARAVVPARDRLSVEVGDLRKVNRVVMRHMLPSTLKRRLEDLSRSPRGAIDHRLLCRIQERMDDFANTRQVLDTLLPRPLSEPPEQRSRLRIQEHLRRGNPRLLVEGLRREIDELRKGSELEDISTFLADLRLGLTGAESSPPIEILLSLLAPKTVEDRLRSYCGERGGSR